MGNFKSMEQVMADLQAKQANTLQTDLEKESSSKQSTICNCNGTGYIIDGWNATKCPCQAVEGKKARLESALIPEEFTNARFDNYVRESGVQKQLFNTMSSYLKVFSEIHSTARNSLGFMAEYGEARLKDLRREERNAVKQANNSYGLGKTHLQMAAAKWLITQQIYDEKKKRMRPVIVLCVSDVSFMNDLAMAKTYRDEGASFHKLLNMALRCDVLIWDDLGKSKYSEAKEDLYYSIINPRYKDRKPIIFSSNEDTETLEDKIGYAAADRLLGMSRDYLIAVKGPSYRTEV